jgi:hypothetical protein
VGNRPKKCRYRDTNTLVVGAIEPLAPYGKSLASGCEHGLVELGEQSLIAFQVLERNVVVEKTGDLIAVHAVAFEQ